MNKFIHGFHAENAFCLDMKNVLVEIFVNSTVQNILRLSIEMDENFRNLRLPKT